MKQRLGSSRFQQPLPSPLPLTLINLLYFYRTREFLHVSRANSHNSTYACWSLWGQACSLCQKGRWAHWREAVPTVAPTWGVFDLLGIEKESKGADFLNLQGQRYWTHPAQVPPKILQAVLGEMLPKGTRLFSNAIHCKVVYAFPVAAIAS